MRKRRICAALLCAVLSLGLSVPCVAAATPEPLVTAEVRKIDDGNTVEVSLKSNVPSQSVQGVLSYDSALLQPISWGGATVSVKETWGPVGTLSHELAAGKPALIKQTGTAGYLYLAAETILGNTLLADVNLVTVRFKCLGATPDQAAAAASVKFATDATIAAETPAHDPAVLIDGLGEVKVIADPKISVTAGPSSGGGGQTVVTGEYAIAFFDWDGSVIDVIAAPKGDATEVVKTFTQTAKAKTALEGKAGYDFDQWLLVLQKKDGLETVYGTPPANNTALPPDNKDLADFTNISGSLLVRASYKANATLNNNLGVVADNQLGKEETRYKFAQPTFYQYGQSLDGANGQYAVRCEISRDSTVRAETPVVYVQVYIGTGATMKYVTSKVPLAGSDVASFEVVVPKDTTKVTYKVVDAAQLDAWTLGVMRSEERESQGVSIVKEGAFTLLMKEAHTVANGSGAWQSVNAVCFNDAGYSKVTAANLSAAQSAFAAASNGLPAPLTRAEADTLSALNAYK